MAARRLGADTKPCCARPPEHQSPFGQGDRKGPENGRRRRGKGRLLHYVCKGLEF